MLIEMGQLNVRLLTSVVITVYVLTQSEGLSASKIFPMFAIINIMATSVLQHTPSGWKSFAEVFTSLRRIEVS